jgi:Domain of unknown function (DUF4349)
MRNYILLTGLLCILFSCNKKEYKNQESASEATAPSTNSISSSAAKETNNPDRKFIRTADIKFKVNNVENSTYNIENICSNHGGFVTFTNLTSNIDEHTENAISKDSILETTLFTVTNTITLRIPNTKLDTTLKDIAKNINYLDYRIIKADDVGLQILSNDMIQTRVTKNHVSISNDIEKNRKKLDETLDAEETVLSKQEIADNAKLKNLSLKDQINFSTINLLIYQRQGIKRNIIANEQSIDKYEIGFGYKIWEGLAYGWKILVYIIVSLSKLWGVLLIASLVFVGYKLYNKKK